LEADEGTIEDTTGDTPHQASSKATMITGTAPLLKQPKTQSKT
jgi:hypothetical protein